MHQAADDAIPLGQVGGRCADTEFVEHNIIDVLFVQNARNLVNAIHVVRGNDCLFGDVGKESDFLALTRWQHPVAATHEDVRLNTDAAQFLHRVLSWFGFHFTRRLDVRDKCEVNEQRALCSLLDTHLPNRFEKWQRFDIPDCATDFDHGHIGVTCPLAHQPNDFVSNVRNNLYRGTEVVAATFAGDHIFVDAASGEVVGLSHLHPDKALVVSEIKIGFGAVIGDEYLAVLKRAHGPRVDIDVGVEF